MCRIGAAVRAGSGKISLNVPYQQEFSHKTHKVGRDLTHDLALSFTYPQEVVEETRVFMINVKRIIAVATTAGLFALVGVSGAQAAESTTPVVKKVALTPEQKAAFDAAKAAFDTARTAFQATHATRVAAVAAAKPVIAAAKAAHDAAVAAATTPEAKKAAHDALKAAVAAAKASIPAKSARPVRPVRP